LAASSVQIDPYSRAFYLTVEIVDEQGNVKSTLMENILHHSHNDVIFNDENINKNFNKIINENLENILESMTIEDQKRGSQIDKIKQAIKEQKEIKNVSSRATTTRTGTLFGALALLTLMKR
jgi:uncharacterized protein (UPF0210 family)